MIIPGVEDTQGITFEKLNNDVLGWYECRVDTSKIVRAQITDPKTFIQSWENCYVANTKVWRTYFKENECRKDSFFVPTKNWGQPSICDTDEIVRHVEALSYLFMFEPNDATTRENLQFALERDLDIFKKQGDINDYCVVCDESINTPSVIDRCQLRVDVAIKPATPAEFIFVPITIGPADDFLNFNLTVETTDEERYERAMRII